MRHAPHPALLAIPLLLAGCPPAPEFATSELVDRGFAMCTPPPTDRVLPVQPASSYEALTPDQQALATQLLAIFENRETSLQYDYVEALGDGRGYTAGALGFTTGTGDALEVVRVYQRLGASGETGRGGDGGAAGIFGYLPELERLESLARSDADRGDLTGLRGFDEAWTAAARDPSFRAAQDSVATELYYRPALRFAQTVGLRSALSRAALLDAIVQHGGGDDPDGLPAMLAATQAAFDVPRTPLEEREWLDRFLMMREGILRCAHAEGTREVWAASVSRVSVFRQLLRAGNMNLEAPLEFELDGRPWVLRPEG